MDMYGYARICTDRVATSASTTDLCLIRPRSSKPLFCSYFNTKMKVPETIIDLRVVILEPQEVIWSYSVAIVELYEAIVSSRRPF